jgi:protein TonB
MWRAWALSAVLVLAIASAVMVRRRPRPSPVASPPLPAAGDTREVDDLRRRLAEAEEARARAEARPQTVATPPPKPAVTRSTPRPVAAPAPVVDEESAALQRLAVAPAQPLVPSSPPSAPPVVAAPPAEAPRVPVPAFVPPLLERKSPPEYPAVAMRQGIQGVVEVKVLVDERGQVADARWISGPPALSEAALASVRNRIYRPATRGGVPVRAWVRERIRFELR